MRLATTLLLALLLGAGLAACGEEEGEEGAVEAMEQNAVELGGITYRVVLFRELNVRTAPDRAVYQGEPPEPGRGYYAAFLTACNTSEEMQTPSSEIILEDAFGQRFERIQADPGSPLAYEPTELDPEACAPPPNSAADETVSGLAVVYSVPYDSIQERPLVLEIAPAQGDPAEAEPIRIILDV